MSRSGFAGAGVGLLLRLRPIVGLGFEEVEVADQVDLLEQRELPDDLGVLVGERLRLLGLLLGLRRPGRFVRGRESGSAQRAAARSRGARAIIAQWRRSRPLCSR